MNWYNDFGFEQNPLEPNPFFSDSFLVKYKHETRWIERSLKAENIVLLEGPESSGKTIIAKELTERMNCLYLDAGRISKNNNIEKLIEILAKYDYRIIVGANPEIQIDALLAEISALNNENK